MFLAELWVLGIWLFLVDVIILHVNKERFSVSASVLPQKQFFDKGLGQTKRIKPFRPLQVKAIMVAGYLFENLWHSLFATCACPINLTPKNGIWKKRNEKKRKNKTKLGKVHHWSHEISYFRIKGEKEQMLLLDDISRRKKKAILAFFD